MLHDHSRQPRGLMTFSGWRTHVNLRKSIQKCTKVYKGVQRCTKIWGVNKRKTMRRLIEKRPLSGRTQSVVWGQTKRWLNLYNPICEVQAGILFNPKMSLDFEQIFSFRWADRFQAVRRRSGLRRETDSTNRGQKKINCVFIWYFEYFSLTLQQNSTD